MIDESKKLIREALEEYDLESYHWDYEDDDDDYYWDCNYYNYLGQTVAEKCPTITKNTYESIVEFLSNIVLNSTNRQYGKIKIGQFYIDLAPSKYNTHICQSLLNCDSFDFKLNEIIICESNGKPELVEVYITKDDVRFKSKNWNSNIISFDELIERIQYCFRLNKLKAMNS